MNRSGFSYRRIFSFATTFAMAYQPNSTTLACSFVSVALFYFRVCVEFFFTAIAQIDRSHGALESLHAYFTTKRRKKLYTDSRVVELKLYVKCSAHTQAPGHYFQRYYRFFFQFARTFTIATNGGERETFDCVFILRCIQVCSMPFFIYLFIIYCYCSK